MKSIRGTLLLYFLALEALVLGAVSFYVYGVTGGALQAKDSRTHKLLEDRYLARRNDIQEKFDEETLRRTQQLARLVVQQRGFPLKLQPLGLLGELHHPFGHITAISWLGQGVDGRLAGWLNWSSTFHLTEQFLPPEGESQDQEYYQVRSERGESFQRSILLGDSNLPLAARARDIGPFTHLFSDAQLDEGRNVRQVTYKVPLYQVQNVQYGPFGFAAPYRNRNTTPGGNRSGRGSSNRSGPNPSRGGMFSAPCVLVVYARDTAARDAMILASRQHLLEDQEQVRKETQSTLTYLRDRLILLSAITFALTALGGAWLVHHGLRPLGQVAEAVRRVSEKDFELHLNDAEIPAELHPVVRRLQEALRSLERAFAHEKQAVADISHELRTPIASLMAAMQVCLRKPRAAEDYRKAMENCLEIAKHLNQLVEQLLTLARLDAGVLPMQPELVNVTELAEQCVDMIRPLAEQQQLTLDFHPIGIVETETDAGKLKEIITNLLSNALQYNKPRGQVNLDVKEVGRRICIEVEDTGIGISAQSQQHLFERFYRADPSRHADTVHAGLGLSIVKGYVDLLGGAIDVESQPGRGSTFRVWLPLRVPAELMFAS